MSASIAILTGNHLCRNPRVIKEAITLQNAGYEVEVIGGWIDTALKAEDQQLARMLKIRYKPVQDLTEQPLARLLARTRSRIARAIHSKTERESCWQLGYFPLALRAAARRRKGDLLIAHSEQALWSITSLAKDSGRRLGVDMEDWFSEDLPPETRKHRPVKLLKNCESTVLRAATHSTCTSRAMSEALALSCNCPAPSVIYNAFPWADRARIDGQFKDRNDRSVPSIHWYSQTIGPDRGLDDLFAALPLLKQEVEVHLRGKPAPGFEEWLAGRVSQAWRNKRVFIHPLVSNDELLSRIAEHDIGFAGEQKLCRSRDLTVTNKILHYLLGGLAVVASDTAGQREIAARSAEAVRVYRAGDAEALAAALNTWLASREALQVSKAAALRVAESVFCWERQEPVLIKTVETAFRV